MGLTKMGSIEIEKKIVKREIQNKFGSVRRFAKIANLELYFINNCLRSGVLKDSEKLREIRLAVAKWENKNLEGEITDKQRIDLRLAILENDLSKDHRAPSLRTFCRRAHTSGLYIGPEYLSLVLNPGPKAIKKVTPKIRRICKLINFEI